MLALVFEAVTGCPAILTVGVLMVSDAVNVKVTVSPALAREVFALFDLICTEVKVGTVLSKVTLVAGGVVDVTSIPGLPARSLKSIINGTNPSASVEIIT